MAYANDGYESDQARPERQRFLHPEATMPVRTFYGWLFMAFAYGACAGVVGMGLYMGAM